MYKFQFLGSRGYLRLAATATLFAGLALGLVLALLPPDWDDSRTLSSGFLVHVTGFAMITLFASLTFGRRSGRLTAIAAGMFVYGVVVEAAQTQVHWRNGQLVDLIYNSAGITVGIGLYLVMAPCLAMVRARVKKSLNLMYR